MKSKYITEFNETGESTVNVDLICKNWNDKFTISTWNEEHTFSIKSKLKTIISKEQALIIVEKLNLIHVKSTIYKSAGVYRSKEFVMSEIKRIGEIVAVYKMELDTAMQVLYEFERAI